MRLLHTFKDDRHAKTFSSFLTQEMVENQLEITKNTDWGSDHYGDILAKVWVIDEDDWKAAHQWLSLYLENPNDPRFQHLKPKGPDLLETIEPEIEIEEEPVAILHKTPPPPPARQPMGPATLYLLMLCSLIFIISTMTSRSFEPYPSKLPYQPLFNSTLENVLYYDYPHAFEIIDQLIASYGIDKVIHPEKLPEEGRILLEQYLNTPYWTGLYDKIVTYIRDGPSKISWQAPLFEKLREGEVWRLLTPVLLHVDLFHLFFNMLWLIILGRQIEKKLGILRFLLLVVITGVISNTCQYLMSGPNFEGFSGVLVGMIVFVWFRQKRAPWEGYQLLPSTMKFITVFILVLAAIGVLSFFVEVANGKGFPVKIANTAHLTGGVVGYFLSRMKFFSWKMK